MSRDLYPGDWRKGLVDVRTLYGYYRRRMTKDGKLEQTPQTMACLPANFEAAAKVLGKPS